jgi:hypothetical protein
LMRLSAESRRLSELIAQATNSTALSGDQLTELLRLRNEAGQLQHGAAERARLETVNEQLRASKAAAAQQLAEAQAAPNYWPKDQLRPAGYADPESAMKSMLSAMTRGDAGSWRRSCTPEALAQMENRRKQHGISEEQEAEEIKGMIFSLTYASAGFRILDQQVTSPEETIVNLAIDGEGKARKFVLRRVGSEWKIHDLIVDGPERPGVR